MGLIGGVEGGGLFCLIVPTFQGYNNNSFQLVYYALSALSRQDTPSYPYMLKWKLAKTQEKSPSTIKPYKIVHRLSGGGGGGGGGERDFRWGGEILCMKPWVEGAGSWVGVEKRV